MPLVFGHVTFAQSHVCEGHAMKCVHLHRVYNTNTVSFVYIDILNSALINGGLCHQKYIDTVATSTFTLQLLKMSCSLQP